MSDSTDTMVVRSIASVTLIGEAPADGGELKPMNLGGAVGDGGVFLEKCRAGEVVEARTANHRYRLRYLGHGQAEISGHPRYCPEPIRVRLNGSRWLDSSLSESFVGTGMQLRFTDSTGRSVLTSPIESVRRLDKD